MPKEIETYKQQLFETAAEYGRAGRAAYQELEQHIDDALENGERPKAILADLGEPESAIRKILKADGKGTYPLGKILSSGVVIAVGLAFLAGVSGLLMPLGSKIAGMRAISGDADGLPYTAARCADFRRLVPAAHNCREAAQLHHYYEITDGRMMLTVLSVIAFLGIWFALRRQWLHVLPRKTLVLLASCTYTVLGGVAMVLALGDLSAARTWQWLGNFLTGVTMFAAGVLLLAYYLGYVTAPRGRGFAAKELGPTDGILYRLGKSPRKK